MGKISVFAAAHVLRAVETDEELLIFEVSDDALERAASIGVGLSVVSLNFGTSIVGNCACPV